AAADHREIVAAERNDRSREIRAVRVRKIARVAAHAEKVVIEPLDLNRNRRGTDGAGEMETELPDPSSFDEKEFLIRRGGHGERSRGGARARIAQLARSGIHGDAERRDAEAARVSIGVPGGDTVLAAVGIERERRETADFGDEK